MDRRRYIDSLIETMRTGTVPQEVREKFQQSAKWFATPLQQFQFFDKYARFNWELGRYEVWEETVDRVVEYLRELAGGKLQDSVFREIREGILHMDVMPSMRLMATAGEAARRDNTTIYNCAYMPIDDLESFVEGFLLSLSGCGVGFSVENRYVSKLPVVAKQGGGEPERFIVPDSVEGWGEALRRGLHAWFNGRDVDFDFSSVRPEGAILRTKGGRASGPESLQNMLRSVREVILSRQGQFLSSVDVYDIMGLIGNSVISGGVRRVAMNALFDAHDMKMLACKQGDFYQSHAHRAAVSTTLVVPYDASKWWVAEIFRTVLESDNGEPGLFFRDHAVQHVPRRRQCTMFGMNPSLAAGTLVYTSKGIYPIEQLEKEEFVYVRNLRGGLSKAKCFQSGLFERLYRIRLSPVGEYYATAEHKWPVLERTADGPKIVRITTAEVCQRCQNSKPVVFVQRRYSSLLRNFTYYSQVQEGLFLGEYTRKRFHTYWRPTGFSDPERPPVDVSQRFYRDLMIEVENWYKEYLVHFEFYKAVKKSVEKSPHQSMDAIPQMLWEADDAVRRGYLAGLLLEGFGDTIADSLRKSIAGSLPSEKETTESSLRLWAPTEHFYLSLAALLGFYGIAVVPLPEHFACQPATKKDALHLAYLVRNTKFPEEYMTGFEERPVVECHETDRYEPVWDITLVDEDPDRCFQLAFSMTGNCGEIILRERQMCNLSSAIIRPKDTMRELARKVRLASIIGTIQSCALHFPNLRSTWEKNCAEERLLGVDLSGFADAGIGKQKLGSWIPFLRQLAVSTNIDIAKELGIPPSRAVTCIKPSGNSAVLLGCSSGIHPRWSQYYVRNVRVSRSSPMYALFRAINYPIFPEVGQSAENARTFVVPFPVMSPEGAVVRSDLSAVDLCELTRKMLTLWAEHNVSVTVYFHEREFDDLHKWLCKNYEDIIGITFLKTDGKTYELQPYQQLHNIHEYQSRVAKLPDIDFSLLWFEREDFLGHLQTPGCESKVCEL